VAIVGKRNSTLNVWVLTQYHRATDRRAGRRTDGTVRCRHRMLHLWTNADTW